MEATKSIMLLPEQIKTEADEYSDQEWVPNPYVLVLMKSELTLPIRMRYNFGNSLLLTKMSYVS
jgi:hypothetical protein